MHCSACTPRTLPPLLLNGRFSRCPVEQQSAPLLRHAMEKNLTAEEHQGRNGGSCLLQAQLLTWAVPCRGTLPYMAPELVSDPDHVTETADVWR